MFGHPIHKIKKTITIIHVYKLPFHYVPKLAKDNNVYFSQVAPLCTLHCNICW